MDRYYAFPLSFGNLLQKGSHKKVDLEQSVRQNIELMLQTPNEQHEFSPFYGCAFNLFQFENPESASTQEQWEEQLKSRIRESLMESIRRYEPRLKVVRKLLITTNFPKPDEKRKTEQGEKRRKSVQVTLEGLLINDAPFYFFKELPLG
jgi:phage baseplate assembly protein W